MKVLQDAPQQNKQENIKTTIDDTKNKVLTFIDILEEHLENDDFDAEKDSLDFLEVKNSLMLTYLIDLTQLVRLLSQSTESSSSSPQEVVSSCLARLYEMKTTFDKIRPLEKKLQYQIDKLLSQDNAASFASSDNAIFTEDDPLSFRPNPDNMMASEEANDDSNNKTNKDSSHLYQPPRLTTAHYPPTSSNPSQMDKKHRNRMIQSEFLQTLQSQITDKPEEDDAKGGAAVGTQRESSRRFLVKQDERLKYEESNMVRLPQRRKDRKDFNKVLREERGGDIAGITDLGKLAGDIGRMDKSHRSRGEGSGDVQKQEFNKKDRLASNTFQKTLYGVDGDKKKKKKKS